ncbi:hypothetical protein BVRB_021970 [Beta vulgaris subsp. vulgaris]|uniref:26S proteasome regulatory subunit RPN2 C-terminal domain-containing protein n=1 Tax=Beta vulgaris subsp. vulgaris TaxID=3555 RepID=A0A0J8B3F2_BETVV|nr:hypothetical protein BVRB_021970 [Beta vulgaris subsp. vulgaris]
MPTAQLSISAKAKAKQLKKKRGGAAGSDASAMDVDQTGVPTTDAKPAAATTETPQEEPDSEQLQNPSRVTPAQRKVMTCPAGRYVPIKNEFYGIVIVKDTQPGDPEELVEIEKPKAALGVGEEEEPQPPAPFQFTR